MKLTLRTLRAPPPPPMTWLVPRVTPAAGLAPIVGAVEPGEREAQRP